MKQTILVTGGAGYIGSHTVKLLLEKKYDVIILDSLVNGHKESVDKKAKFYQADLGNKDAIRKVFQDNKIDCVIHFAAFIEAGESMVDPKKFFRNNLVNTINLLDIMLESDVKKIIFSSTAAVYGEPEYTPIDEKHPTKPTNYYGLTKRMIERILDSYHHAYGLKYIALRYFNACGAHPKANLGENHNPETHLIPLILQAAKGERKKIMVFGTDYKTNDGSCIRDYIHVCDLAEAHIKAMEKLNQLNADQFNLGNGKGYSVLEVINECKKITRKDFKVELAPRRPGDPTPRQRKSLAGLQSMTLNQLLRLRGGGIQDEKTALFRS